MDSIMQQLETSMQLFRTRDSQLIRKELMDVIKEYERRNKNSINRIKRLFKENQRKLINNTVSSFLFNVKKGTLPSYTFTYTITKIYYLKSMSKEIKLGLEKDMLKELITSKLLDKLPKAYIDKLCVTVKGKKSEKCEKHYNSHLKNIFSPVKLTFDITIDIKA